MEKDYFHDIDQIRRQEYPMLEGTTYLDHAGTALYAKSLVDQFSKDLLMNLFGNPHSASASSELSTQRIERVRLRVLQFFKADPEQFDVVFVANATAAIKMVMVAFQDHAEASTDENPQGFWYGYHRDSHTSLVGIRQLATEGSRCFESNEEVEDWLSDRLDAASNQSENLPNGCLGLFAYPAQSNMNGHRPPLSWSGRLRKSFAPGREKIYTLLDAAAYVSTAQLDLSDADTAPDFVALSFYKIFGFPDLGALIVRKASGKLLQQRRYFGGGTVDMVIAMGEQWHAKKEHHLHEQLEDGTLPFHNIIALDSALDVHERLYGSMLRISAHTCYLARLLYEKLCSLHHGNGSTVCEIYQDSASRYGDSRGQAPTVAFNLRNSQGGWIGKSDFERLAIVHNIQLRTGGVCNSGGIASSLKLRPWEMRRNYSEGVRCGNELDLLGGKPTGIVRVSFGAMSNLRDVETFVNFVQKFYVEKVETISTIQTPTEDFYQQNLQCRVASLRISPIEGCLDWEVPFESAWELKGGSLAWDREWCVVHLMTREVLSPQKYPDMRLLQPSLHVEEGILRVRKASESNLSADQLTVSLWESPPFAQQQASSEVTGRKADPYDSANIAQFFTTSLGVPCTLARFPDTRRSLIHTPKPQQQPRPYFSPLQFSSTSQQPDNDLTRTTSSIIEHPLTMATTTSIERPANLILTDLVDSSTSPSQHEWRYLRVGKQYFQTLDMRQHTDRMIEISTTEDNIQDQTVSPQKHLRLLNDLNDRSLAAQNPTISKGDPVQVFTMSTAAEDSKLRACIASSYGADFVCPVPACGKGLNSMEDIAKHIHIHKTVPFESRTAPASLTTSDVDTDPLTKSVEKIRWGRGTSKLRRFLFPSTFRAIQYTKA
ncbi:hypothetical protein MMC16_002172 [Acarospora aff. strigata]|nr:hypothetical protein [Acarospora aff. strigata]